MTLVRAARDGDFAKVAEIVEQHPDYVDAADLFGETPLLESIYNGHVEIALFLLEHGANPCLCRGDGTSPLHIAANKGRYHIAMTLLKNEKVRNQINKKDSLGNTPLHAACKKTQVDLVQLLVDNGANVNYINKRGQRPINYTRDVRLYRILRGQKWYDDLEGDAIIARLKNGDDLQTSSNSPNSPNKNNKKKRRRRGGRNRNKNKNNVNIDNNNNNNHNDNNDKEEEKQEIVTKESKKKRKRKKLGKGGKNDDDENNVSNKELDNDLRTWLEFNDCVSVETLQKYQMVYFDKKLKMKWINYMRSIRKHNLNINDYNRKMCLYADGLLIEYSQPQYDVNHYTPQQLNEYDEDSDDY